MKKWVYPNRHIIVGKRSINSKGNTLQWLTYVDSLTRMDNREVVFIGSQAMRTIVLFVIVACIFWVIEKSGGAAVKFVESSYDYAVEYFRPAYSWEETKPSAENDAREYLLSVVQKAFYSYDSGSVNGVKLKHSGYIDRRSVRKSWGTTVESINILKEISDNKARIVAVKIDDIFTTQAKGYEGMKVVRAIVYTEIPDQILGSRYDPRVNASGINVFFNVDTNAKWLPKEIWTHTPGASYLSQYDLFGHEELRNPQWVSDFYMSKYALAKESYESHIQYAKNPELVKHLTYNARAF